MLFDRGANFKNGAIAAIVGAIVALPVLAETANFGTLTLSPGFESPTAVLRGATGGSYSLSAIANADRHKNKCLGFATPTPDHIIVLQQKFSKLTLQVNSGARTQPYSYKGPVMQCAAETMQVRIKMLALLIQTGKQGLTRFGSVLSNPELSLTIQSQYRNRTRRRCGMKKIKYHRILPQSAVLPRCHSPNLPQSANLLISHSPICRSTAHFPHLVKCKIESGVFNQNW